MSTEGSIDLSTAMKLKKLVFQCRRPTVKWVTESLQTAESKDLERITVRPDPDAFEFRITGLDRRGWHDLDRLLVQFWDSHSIRPRVTYEAETRRRDIRHYAPSLLPELTRRGLVDLVKYGSGD